jgi:MinD superfamily P-loop ATPase
MTERVPVKIAIASGKGGTGKTTVAVGLALTAGRCQLLDCDVEEPNAQLLLGAQLQHTAPVTVRVPVIDAARCNLCGRCTEACQFHALAQMGKKLLTFPALCHGCGACLLACPQGAIQETARQVGMVERGQAGEIAFVQGRLHVGEAMATPVIRAVKAQLDPGRLVFIDAAPGTACPVVEAVKGCDFCLLVTEPTPFGLHDLRLAVAVMQIIGLPCGVVINRAGAGDEQVEAFCEHASLPLLGKIPFARAVAQAYAQGQHPVRVLPEIAQTFAELLPRLLLCASQEAP